MSLLQKAEKKIIRTYVINESIYKQFKDVAEKDMRKLSNQFLLIQVPLRSRCKS